MFHPAGGAGTESGELVYTKELRLDVRGRDVLLVDDILDTGKTLYRVSAKLLALNPRRLKTCVLLNKAARRVEPIANAEQQPAEHIRTARA